MDLSEYFAQHNRAALAFSGGVDSVYLLYAAVRCGADVQPYYVRSQFQPEFEFRDALRIARQLGVEMKILPKDILACEPIAANPSDRCYYCKRQIMGSILSAAAADGYELLLDGTNASDRADDRPGMKVLTELKIQSPLRICGLTKAEIRRLSKEAGLFTWNKPAYACLATRVGTGERITEEKLAKIEAGEAFLTRLGFSDFRLRLRGDRALLQFTAEQMPAAAAAFDKITNELGPRFTRVEIDAEPREKTV